MRSLLHNNKGNTPSTILISCMALVAIIIGLYFVASTSLSEYGETMDESFGDSMDKSNELLDQYDSMDQKISNTTGMYDSGTGSLLFDGLNSIVLGLRATRAIISDFVGNIGAELGIHPVIIMLISAMLIIVLIAAIISALWSRDI